MLNKLRMVPSFWPKQVCGSRSGLIPGTGMCAPYSVDDNRQEQKNADEPKVQTYRLCRALREHLYYLFLEICRQLLRWPNAPLVAPIPADSDSAGHFTGQHDFSRCTLALITLASSESAVTCRLPLWPARTNALLRGHGFQGYETEQAGDDAAAVDRLQSLERWCHQAGGPFLQPAHGQPAAQTATRYRSRTVALRRQETRRWTPRSWSFVG